MDIRNGNTKEHNDRLAGGSSLAGLVKRTPMSRRWLLLGLLTTSQNRYS